MKVLLFSNSHLNDFTHEVLAKWDPTHFVALCAIPSTSISFCAAAWRRRGD